MTRAAFATMTTSTHWEGNPYRRPNSPFWHIVFEDASGRQRRKSTRSKDRRIATEILAETLRRVEKQRVGHVDRYAEARALPIDRYLVAYQQHLEQEESAPRYIKGTIRIVREFIEFAAVATVPAITFGDATRFLEDVLGRRSTKTRDHYAGALRSFGRWLHRTGRWDCDPFQGVRIKTATKDRHRKFKRVGLRFEEAERLVEAAMARFHAEKHKAGQPTHEEHATGETVRDRQVLYWFTLTTAFRAKECASIRWEDLALDGDRMAVRLSGHFTKNGDDALIPLQPFVAEAIKDMRRRRSTHQMRLGNGPVLETDHVFHVSDKIARLVRKDAEYAGLIPQRSPTNKRIDFHSLRKSCARILIELGLHPKLIQQTLRHCDIRLTMDLYGELGDDDLFRELRSRFPVPKLFAGVCTPVCTDSAHTGASPGTAGHENEVAANAPSPTVLHG